MGNWNSRRKSADASDSSRRRKQRNKKQSSSEDHVDSADKFVSCPDLGGAVPYQYQDDPKINITVYRSYGDLERAKSGSMREDRPEIKIYRRSTTAIPKSATLPHNWQVSRSKSYAGSSGKISSGAYPELRRSKDTLDSGSDYQGSRRPSSGERYTYRRAPVYVTDFPSTSDIKRRLALFENSFARNLVDKYSNLSDTLQVSALSIAIRKGSTGYQTVSLLDYLSGSNIPEDLDDNGTNEAYTLTIPRALLHGITHVRRDKLSDMRLWTSLAGDVVTCVGIEAANEIARIYEYQIAMVSQDSSIGAMAEHAAECVIEYIKTNSAFLDRNTTILGVLYGRPFKDISRPKLISVIIGERELKWDLFDIFKNAGLRKEIYLVQDDVLQAKDEDLETTRSSTEDEDGVPWKCYIASNSDPLLYGYRGQVLEWQFVQGVFNMHAEDDVKFTREMTFHPEDFHRMYMPYRRLVGLGVMQNFCQQSSGPQTQNQVAAPAAKKKGLSEFVMVPQDGASGREEVQPVYRPLHPAGDTLAFDNAVLDNADLTRIQLDEGTNLNGASVKNARLLLAEVDDSTVERANLRGADMSYSTVARTDPSKLQGQGATVKHVAFCETTTVLGPGKNRTRKTKQPQDNNTPVFCDGDGKVVQVEQVIQHHQKKVEETAARKAVEEEEEKAKERQSLERSPVEPVITTITTTTTSSSAPPPTTSAAAKKIKKIKKKKIKSTGSASSPEGSDPRLNRSFSAGQYDRGPPANDVGLNGQVVRPTSTNPHFAEAPLRRTEVAVVQGSPRQGVKSLSATNVNVVETRPGRGQRHQAAGDRTTFPRMTKSVSHHGQLTNTGDVAWYSGSRRQLSQVEIEFIRRSQVFRMIQGLQIENLENNLPAKGSLFLGRQKETADVLNLLDTSGKLVLVTGCPGIGKSSFALSVAHLAPNKYMLPIYIDGKDAANSTSIFRRMVSTFGLRFKMRELDLFYNWINCHEQRVLFLLDNLDFAPEEDERVSQLMDNFLQNIKNLTILCTSQRSFFRGASKSEVYKLGDLREQSEDMLRQLTPDLHDEGIRELAEVCDHVPYVMITAAVTLSTADVDSGKLFEDLTLNLNGTFSVSKQDELVASILQEECDKQRLTKQVCCVKKIIDNLPAGFAQILFRMSHTAFSFDAATTATLTEEFTEKTVSKALNELASTGLLQRVKDTDRYTMPLIVRLVAQACDVDPVASVNKHCRHFLEVLKTICCKYHSKSCEESVKFLDKDYDNIVHVLRCIVEGEEVYDLCVHFGEVEYIMLLNEILPVGLYNELYSNLYMQAADKNDTSTQSRALCAMSYHYISRKDYDAAKQSAEKAYEILHSADKCEGTDKAFCLQCMARVTWQTSEERQDKDKALVLAKKALDILKSSLGLRSVQTLYANELYGWMLMQRESYQTARHYYNVSDFLVKELLDEHPEMLHGYDCRRIIWDGLFLFARATDTAKKAADVATRYHGEHPITATMVLRLCDSIIKRGSLNDAIDASVTALSMRVKTLGDHIDTAHAYKTLAYLMLRSGQYDEAVRFSQSALEIYEKEASSTERMKIDVKNIIAQARYRLEYKSSVFVELESKDASKPNVAVADESHVVNTSMVSSVISTEV